MYLPSMWLSDILAITNSNDDSTPPWKTPLSILTSDKIFPPAVCSMVQFFIVFSINFIISSDTLYILKLSIIQLCGTILHAFLLSIYDIAKFCTSFAT